MSFECGMRWFKSKLIRDKGDTRKEKRKTKTTKARKKKCNQNLCITKLTLHQFLSGKEEILFCYELFAYDQPGRNYLTQLSCLRIVNCYKLDIQLLLWSVERHWHQVINKEVPESSGNCLEEVFGLDKMGAYIILYIDDKFQMGKAEMLCWQLAFPLLHIVFSYLRYLSSALFQKSASFPNSVTRVIHKNI